MSRRQPHIELLPAGDFKSPMEVMASSALTPARKRDILEFWQQDLDRKRELPDARTLLAAIRIAIASLDALDRRERAEELAADPPSGG